MNVILRQDIVVWIEVNNLPKDMILPTYTKLEMRMLSEMSQKVPKKRDKTQSFPNLQDFALLIIQLRCSHPQLKNQHQQCQSLLDQ